jgi:signal transduction histidine kinase
VEQVSTSSPVVVTRWGWLNRLRPSRRVVLLVLPLHLAAFLILYFGTVGILEQEILAAHSRDAALLLDQAVANMHPSMVSHDSRQVRTLLRDFIAHHALLDLKLYDHLGNPVGHDTGAGQSVMVLLQERRADRFEFAREGNRVILEGMMRITNAPACAACHSEPGGVVGIATMRVDMTASVRAAQRRLRQHLAFLVVGWALLVGALNIALMTLARRSISKLESSVGAAPGRERRHGGVPRAILDPVSEELFVTLRRALERERQQAAEVSSRMQETQRLAELGQLAAGLAHEIKNPLAGVHGALELLRDDTSPAGRDVYDQMLAELDRVNGTIHALLNFARPSRPNRVLTDIHELLESAARLLRPTLARRGVALEVESAPGMRQFSLDPGQMRQVLVNLISNAADAIDKGGRIEVRAAPLPDGSGVVLAVTDNGPGIAPTDQDRIFEPFYTTKFTGTGLGLSVVRSLVEQHGGHVKLTSEPGKGATFLVVLPEQPGMATLSGKV